MEIKITEFLIIIFIFINLSCASLNKEGEYYNILKEIQSDSDIGYSFIKLKNYLRENPDSIYKPEIRFAICEYYLQIRDYRDAINELTKYIIDYPENKNTVIAWVILYKIMLDYKDESLLLEKLKEKFFSKSLFLVFSDSKIKYYNSILNNTYKIIDYVDKIEVFKNNGLFLKITP